MSNAHSFKFRSYNDVIEYQNFLCKNYTIPHVLIERDQKDQRFIELIYDHKYNLRECGLPPFNYYWDNLNGKEEIIFHLGNSYKDGGVAIAETIYIDILNGQMSWHYSEARFDAYCQYIPIYEIRRKISYEDAQKMISQCNNLKCCTGHTLEEFMKKGFEQCLSPEYQKIRSEMLYEHNHMMEAKTPLTCSINKSWHFKESYDDITIPHILSIFDFDTRKYYYIRNTTQGYRFLLMQNIDPEVYINAVPTEKEIADLFIKKIDAKVCDRLLGDNDVKMLKRAIANRSKDNQERIKFMSEKILFISLDIDGTGEFNIAKKSGDLSFLREIDILSMHTYAV